MTSPLYPSLIPRYVDENWFISDQPVDEAAKLNELEANHEVMMREPLYRNYDVQDLQEPTEDEGNEDEDEDEDEINEGDEEDEDDLEEGDELDEELTRGE